MSIRFEHNEKGKSLRRIAGKLKKSEEKNDVEYSNWLKTILE